MSTITRWVVPCYFSEENFKTTPITFNLTDHLKLFLTNEVWNRKYHYGFDSGLKNTDKSKIERVTITIHPRFISGFVNEKRIPQLIEKECGKIPAYLNVKSYKEWSYHNGVAILETEYSTPVKNIPTKSDLHDDYMPHYDMDFIEVYHRHLAVLKEVSSFFLATLHLSFQTSSVIMPNDNPLNDGFLQIVSGDKSYCSRVSTNAYMHEILIETSKLENVKLNLDGLASVWHLNLWPLKRYLNAVESDQISMDNLLDLIYALEGLFEKNASSDFIKMLCISVLCTTRKEAREKKSILDLAYRIRNDIAHGERSYDPFDKVKLDGKEILAQNIYWEMKVVTASMLIKAISKLLSNKEMKNLRFIDQDLLIQIFKK